MNQFRSQNKGGINEREAYLRYLRILGSGDTRRVCRALCSAQTHACLQLPYEEVGPGTSGEARACSPDCQCRSSLPDPQVQRPPRLWKSQLRWFLSCFPHVCEMLCTKGKLYSVNIYAEKWFAVLPPWRTWRRMKAWYMRLPAEDRKWNPLLNIFPAFMRQL